MTVSRRCTIVVPALLPVVAAAHGPASHDGAAIWSQWELDPVVVVPLLLATWLYLQGLGRLWRRAGVGRGISRRRSAFYLAGILVLVAALLSPLDAMSSASFGLHMLQHLLLILVAPPLLVTGAADVAFLWALPVRFRRGFGRFENSIGRWLGGTGGSGRSRLVVVALATGTLWLWHMPVLYDMAVRHEPLHIVEHVGFLVTALLFWAGVLRLRRVDHVHNGERMLSVAAMALQGSLLGALITFAGRPLYQSHLQGSFLGLDPLVDQQIAGLLMWIPPAFLYMGVFGYLFVRWLDAVGRRRSIAASEVADTPSLLRPREAR